MNDGWKNFISPFGKVAGAKALLWGLAGMAVSAALSVVSGWHAHGLLHFGAAPNNAWWVHIAEYAIIWLVPSAIVYSLGAALSKSRIRPIDVAGTVLFAQIPLAAMNMTYLLPGMENLLTVADPASLQLDALKAAMATPSVIVAVVITVAAIVLMLVWLFNAAKVSCNLKGWQLWTVYLAGVAGGDAVCRLLIGLMY